MSDQLRIKSQAVELPSLVQHPDYVKAQLQKAPPLFIPLKRIGGAFFKIGAFPERALKYGLGIDAYFSQDRRWSFAEIGKKFDGSWKDNPIVRFQRSPGFLIQGILESFSKIR